MATADATEDVECPTCGRDDFETERGMKYHHTRKHGESLSRVSFSCDCCGEEFERNQSEVNDSSEYHYCSLDCKHEHGEYALSGKNHPSYGLSDGAPEELGDRGWLVEEYVEKERYAYEIADDLGVGPNTVIRALQRNRISVRSGGVQRTEDLDSIEIECPTCSGVFSARPSRQKYYDTLFCSLECRVEAQTPETVKLTCHHCGSGFERRAQRVRYDNQFCSHKCYIEHLSEQTGADNRNWVGGSVEYYGPNWKTQRARAKRRDQYRCLSCRQTEPESIERFGCGLVVHHIAPIRQFEREGSIDYKPANKLSNLVTLCSECHPTWEKMAPLRPETGRTAD